VVLRILDILGIFGVIVVFSSFSIFLLFTQNYSLHVIRLDCIIVDLIKINLTKKVILSLLRILINKIHI